MTKISKPFAELRGHSTTVLVVGSGYGGAIAASRLARAGQSVTLVERGREIRPGGYPRYQSQLLNEMQVSLATTGEHAGPRDGLFDLQINEDVNVLVGCGLGGTSLINANVSLEADPRVFLAEGWPTPLRDGSLNLAPYYQRARAALGATPYPQTSPSLPKLKALEIGAQALGQPISRPPINVSFTDGPNTFGFEQSACTLCGDCCTGCNYAAKNTTLMNYLPDARAFGADIYTGTTVSHLEKTDQGWRVHLQSTLDETATQIIDAKIVLLGAGTLGSTGILLRSRENGLTLSEQLGQRFSGNGDVLAFGYNANIEQRTDAENGTPIQPSPIRGVGAGPNSPDTDHPEFQPGPCIAGVIDCRDETDVRKSLVIEEGVMPGPLASTLSAAFFVTTAIQSDPLRFLDAKRRLLDAQQVSERIQSGADMRDLAFSGPLSRTISYLVMSHDSARGSMALGAKGQIAVRWPDAGREAAFRADNDKLRTAAEAIWAESVANPIWSEEMGRKLITVHPIGGCAMGDDARCGVVDAYGRVFNPDGGIHEGLYVCDGAILPAALGVNPLLTISALAEHIVETLALDHGWRIDFEARRELPAPILARAAAPESFDQSLAQLLAALTAFVDCAKTKDTDGAMQSLGRALAQLPALLEGLGVSSTSKLAIEAAIAAFLASQGDAIVTAAPLVEKSLPFLAGVLEYDSNGSLTPLFDALETMGDFSPGMGFDETMRGFVSSGVLDPKHCLSSPYDIAASQADAQDIIGRFKIRIDTLAQLTADPLHRAHLSGEVDCALLGGTCSLDPATAQFALLAPDATRVASWQMIYSGALKNPNGKRFFFRGIKTLERRTGSNWWSDLTRLAVDIFDGPEETGPIIAQGRMDIDLAGLAAAAMSLHIPSESDLLTDLLALINDISKAPSLSELDLDPTLVRTLVIDLLDALAQLGRPGLRDGINGYYANKFVGVFAQTVFRAYGSIYAYLANFPAMDHEARPPARRSDLPKGTVHDLRGAAGQIGRLTRYKGGSNGPVILAPGFAVAASSFHMMTTDQSLTEYLFHAGYDVWLFDYRGSPALEASTQPFTIDDIAQQDWPTAVATVLRESGAPDCQVIAHCYGSMSVLMAVLNGMQGIRSIIASQTSLHPVTSALNYAKADAHLPSLLINGIPEGLRPLFEAFIPDPEIRAQLESGLKTVSLTPDPKATDQSLQQMIDLLLWGTHFPLEKPCYNPVCHRTFGFFGAIYAHDQLNDATHSAMMDVVGTVSTEPFKQIAQMIRAGRTVDAHGADTYLPNGPALTMPIDFLAGERNQIFLPETTQRTMNWLREIHGDWPQTKFDARFTRHLFRGYAHMDLFIGKSAHIDIFPYLLERLQTRGKA